MDNVLNDSDYTMGYDVESLWITVDNLSVRVQRTESGVRVQIFTAGDETGPTLGEISTDGAAV